MVHYGKGCPEPSQHQAGEGGWGSGAEKGEEGPWGPRSSGRWLTWRVAPGILAPRGRVDGIQGTQGRTEVFLGVPL